VVEVVHPIYTIMTLKACISKFFNVRGHVIEVLFNMTGDADIQVGLSKILRVTLFTGNRFSSEILCVFDQVKSSID
jgi:hypothetical protein